jgi:hypothetical protein
MRTARFVKTLVLTAALCLPAVAFADQESERLFNEGKTAFEAGNFAKACKLFAESFRLHEGTGTLLNLAACHEKEGKPWLAYNEYRLAETRAASAGQQERVNTARKGWNDLEPQVARVQLTGAVQGISQVLVDSEPAIGVTPTEPFAVKVPGKRILTVSGPGRKPLTLEVDGEIGKTVSVAVPGTMPAESGGTSAAPSGGPEKSEGNSKALAFVALGVGAVGLGVGSIFGVMRIGDKDDITSTAKNAGCDPATLKCPSQAQLDKVQATIDANKDKADTHAVVSTVGFIVGGIGVAAGIALLLMPSSGSASATMGKARILPSVGAGGGGLTLQGAF